jgi:hypothetical protein
MIVEFAPDPNQYNTKQHYKNKQIWVIFRENAKTRLFYEHNINKKS